MARFTFSETVNCPWLGPEAPGFLNPATASAKSGRRGITSRVVERAIAPSVRAQEAPENLAPELARGYLNCSVTSMEMAARLLLGYRLQECTAFGKIEAA